MKNKLIKIHKSHQSGECAYQEKVMLNAHSGFKIPTFIQESHIEEDMV